MAERLINVDRDTPMLLPPDLRDWVAGNDLALLILEAVELCDLQGASRNVRGSGSAQYPPGMMVALLIYCYASGTFSSRRIERATYDSVAVRYLCGNHHPDHDTIAHFRRQNGGLFARCFATVVQLAREAGLLKLAAISIDGTKLAGAASKGSVRTLAQIEAELRELEGRGAALVAQAEVADRSDVDGCGTQLPPELAEGRARREKLLAAKARIEERRRRAVEEGHAGGAPGTRPPAAKASVSEPESRMLRTDGRGGSVQGYNAQVAADAGQSGLIVGHHLSDEPTDYGLLEKGVACVVAEAGRPAVVLVDKGYEHSERIARVEERHGVMVLCPPARRPQTDGSKTHRSGRKQRVFALRQKMHARLAQPSVRELYGRRAATVEPVFARIKRHMGFTRLHCWGHRAASAEWTLVCLAHNLRLLRGRLPHGKLLPR
jgi:transposase